MLSDNRLSDFRPDDSPASTTFRRPKCAGMRPTDVRGGQASPQELRAEAGGVLEHVLALEGALVLGRPLRIAQVDTITTSLLVLQSAIADAALQRPDLRALVELRDARRSITAALEVTLDLLDELR